MSHLRARREINVPFWTSRRPGRKASRRANTRRIQPTSNAAGWDGSAFQNGAVILRRALSLWMGFSAVVLVCGLGCEGRGTLDVSWTLEGESPGGNSYACSAHGLDVVQIVATDVDSGELHAEEWFPCGAGTGSMAAVSVAVVDVHAFGLAPGYVLLVQGEPVRDVSIVEDQEVTVEVDLPLPRACADRVDNDSDGQIDEADQGCKVGDSEEIESSK